MKTQKPHDVVVIGSGGAGLRAAIGAAEQGARVLVVSRGKADRSGATLLAGANISADIACDGASLARLGISDANRDDTREDWFSDLLHEGFFLNNQKLVSLFVETAGDRVEELMDWGIQIRGTEGDRGISVFGSDILDTLYRKAKAAGAEFLEDAVFTDLVAEDGAVAGAVCLDFLSGELFFLPAKAVILATGGAHNLFPVNSGSTDLCGEGQAAALRAGAELIDMEMISFCPTVVRYPTMYRGNILPYIFFTSGYGHIRNKNGKEFLGKYLSKPVERLALDTEWNKMLLSYALQKEINAGRGTRTGGVYFDLDLHPREVMEELYTDLPQLRKGIYADIMRILEGGGALTVLPAAHYFEGGIRINERAETSVAGLFAAGECTGGMFGANRVSAATTEMLVEGAAAGKSAGAYCAGADLKPAPPDALIRIEEELLRPFGRTGPLRARPMRRELQEIAGGSLTVLRRGDVLSDALSRMNELAGRVDRVALENGERCCNREWLDYLELRSLSLCGRAILRSALTRRESRGVHIREDCLWTDNREYLKNTVVKTPSLDGGLEDVDFGGLGPDGRGKLPYIAYVEQIVGEMSREASQ